MGAWTTWDIDRDTAELVGACCGARFPNTLDGMRQAKEHRCAEVES